MDGLFLIAAALFFFVLPYVLGVLVLEVFCKEVESETRETLIFPLGFIAVAFIQFVNFLVFDGGPGFNAAVYGILVLSGLLVLRHLNRALSFLPGPLTVAFFALFLHGLFVLCITPRYTVGYYGDWRLYFPNVLYFQNHTAPDYFQTVIGREYLIKRTPFLPWIGAFLLSPIASPYYLFQMTALLANGLLFFAGFLFCSRAFDRRTARYFLLLLPLSPLLVRYLTLPVPKMLAAAFFLLSLSFYLPLRKTALPVGAQRKNQIFCALFGCAAYLSHPSMLLYLLGLATDAVLASYRQKRKILSLPIWISLAALSVLPWFLWIGFHFGWRENFLPSVHARPLQLEGSDGYWASRLQIVLTTLYMPLPLWEMFRTQGLPSSWTHLLRDWINPLLRFYWETFAGALGLGGFVVILWTLLRRNAKASFPSQTGWLARLLGIGALLCLAVHMIPDLKGLAGNVFLPLALLQIFCLAFLLARLPKIGQVTVFALFALESGLLLTLIFQVTHRVFSRGFSYLFDETVQRWPGSLWFFLPIFSYGFYVLAVRRAVANRSS